MKKVHDWFLPDHDTHYEYWFSTSNDKDYQKPHRDHALEKVEHFRTAVDIGGNIGFWIQNPVQVENSKPIFNLMESLGYRKLNRYKRDEVLFAKRKA